MKRETTLMTAAAFLVVLGFTAAQAGPQSEPMPSGAPSGNIGAGEGGGMQPGSPGGALNQPTGPGSAGSKGTTAGAAGDAMKEPKGGAGGETGMPGDRKAGSSEGDKAGTTAEGKPDTKTGMSKDDKPGATAEGKDNKDGMSDDRKSGATAEGKDDGKAKDGKSARLESKDISKVKTHFRDNKPNAKRVDRDEVSVSIGIALPGAIALYDLPPGVIVVAGPCPIQYFVWDDDIVLVDSCTREVVEIIADVA